MSNIGNKETLARNLSYYLERSGKTQKDLAEIAGVATSTFSDWMTGKKYPRIDKIETLANYFGCLKSDLIEERTEKDREIQQKNDDLADIVLRLRTDEEFYSVVKNLHGMDRDKLSSLSVFLK